MYIVFDIGGTKTRVASSTDGESLSEPIIYETPQNFELGILTLISKIKDLLGMNEIKGIAGGITGVLDKSGSFLVRSPHLSSWVGRPMKENLEKEFNTKAFLKNDAAMAGLGEATRGAGQGHSIVAYITVSTGIGGVRVLDGKIEATHFGFEPGHHIIDITKMNSLEDMVSGSAFEKRFGKNPSEVDDPFVWHFAAHTLAIGLHNIILHWSPDILVVGGPMVLKSPGISLEHTATKLKEIMKIFPETPLVVKASLGDLNGLYGSLEYIKDLV